MGTVVDRIVQQENRLTEIEKRFRLGLKVFYDDHEFLSFAREMGYTSAVRSWASDLLQRIETAQEPVR